MPISVGSGDVQYVALALVLVDSWVIGSTQNFANKYSFSFQKVEG